MLKRITSFQNHLNEEVQVLNIPDWKEYNLNSLIKTASSKNGNSDLGGFDIKKAMKESPDFLYVKCFSIKQDEVNDNGDCWTGQELKKSAHTFIGVPLFCNHQNDDIEKARGKVVHAWYDEKAKGIYTIKAVDRVAYPKLARSIETGYVVGSSMGCAVSVSVCSCCGNAAKIAEDYCDCVKNRKNRNFTGKVAFAYGKNGILVENEKQCPVKFAVDKDGMIQHKAHKIFEWNFGSKFIEDSFVVNPACHSCGVKEIFNTGEFEKKVASLKDKVEKIASSAISNFECKDGICGIVKTAGVQEIKYITDAMSKMEKVAKSMLAQKQHISMEYVSEIVTAMADIQSILDELVEMGYAQLPSPSIITADSDSDIATSNVPVAPIAQIQQPAKQVQSISPQSQDFSGVGNVTMPKSAETENNGIKLASSENLIENKKEQQELFVKLTSKIASLSNNIEKLKNIKEIKMADSNSIEKTAAANSTLQKQLDDAKFTGKRQGLPEDVVTEKKLDGKVEFNVTKSESPEKRMDSTPDVISEKQLESLKTPKISRWNEAPDVITEKQFTEAHRAIGSELSVDQLTVVTEKQLADFLSKKKYNTPEVTTEKQLKHEADAKEQIKVAMAGLSDAIAFYHKTPAELKSAVTEISSNMNKAAYLTLVNALPHKVASRKAEYLKTSYFSKVASRVATENETAVDAVVAGVANNLSTFAAPEVLAAVKAVIASETAMKKVEAMAKEKMTAEVKTEIVTDKFASALAEMERPEDGMYEVHVALADPELADPINKKAFYKSVLKVANREIADDVKVALTNIDIDEENGVVVAQVKDMMYMSEEEKKAHDNVTSYMFGDETPEEMAGHQLGQAHETHFMDDADNEFGFDFEDESFDDQDDFVDSDPTEGERFDMSKSFSPVASSNKTVKTAQAATSADPMGAPPAAGATMPAAPAAGPAGQAPLESFEQTDVGGEMEDASEETKASPPGTKCPVCGSDDVDVVKGAGKCNNCGSEFSFEVNVKVTRWSGLLEGDEKNEKKEEVSAGEGGFEMPATAASKGNSSVTKTASSEEVSFGEFAAVTRLKPEAVKIATASGAKIGEFSPFTGSKNTVKVANDQHVCLDTGRSYKVEFAHDAKKNVFARFSWNALEKVACESCDRSKKQFVAALKTAGIEEASFEAMPLKEKVETILKLEKAGSLKTIKTASKNEVTSKFASVGGDNFPMARCVQKLANRFGEDAVALSGPCEGKPLHECVCKSLKKASVFSEGLVMKVASAWSEMSGEDMCVTNCVKLGFGLKQASTACSTLKKIYAEHEEVLAEELETPDEDPTPEAPKGPEGSPVDETPDSEEIFGEKGTVHLELPLDLVNKLEEAIDVANGQVPSEEAHHDMSGKDGSEMVEVELPLDASEVVEDAAEKTLDEVEGAEKVQTKLDNVMEHTKDKAEEAISEEVEEKLENKNPGVLNTEQTNEPVEKAGEQEKLAEAYAHFGQSKIARSGKINLDLSALEKVLAKKASKETSGQLEVEPLHQKSERDIALKTKKIEHVNVQDSVDFPQGNALIGEEKEVKLHKIEVPTGKALQGKEVEVKTVEVEVPAGSKPMGEEKLEGGDVRATGGEDGAGSSKVANSKSIMNKLADRIVAASEKKVEKAAPVSEDKDIQPISGKSLIGDEKEIKSNEVKDSEVKSEGTFIGKQKQTLKSKPDSPKDNPTIPVGDARMGEETLEGEKETKVKGTVIAESSEKDAIRLASKMLQAGQITPEQMFTKVTELKQYKSAQILDLEKALFASKKGFATEANGSETAVIVPESANVKDDFTGKLASMFKLDKQVKIAQATDVELRKLHGR